MAHEGAVTTVEADAAAQDGGSIEGLPPEQTSMRARAYLARSVALAHAGQLDGAAESSEMAPGSSRWHRRGDLRVSFGRHVLFSVV